MKAHIKNIENGLGVLIPDEYVKYLNFHSGSIVDIGLDKKRGVIIISHISESEDIVKRYISSAEAMA